MYPPTTGPRTGADIAVIDQIPRAVARFCAGKIAINNAWLPGTIGPDTAPCKMRNTISDGRLQAIPQRNDAIVNASTAAVKVRTTPKRPINQPVSGTVTPLATANDVITQVPLSVLTPRFPAIVGSDTLAMVESRTCMKLPSASATDVRPNAMPASGASCPPVPLPLPVLVLLPALMICAPHSPR